MTHKVYDAVIVGGGAAGLSAALTLGRACRNAIVCDDGRPRNAVVDRMHGFLSRDGTHPDELLKISREQLSRYQNVEFAQTHISQAKRQGEHFLLRSDDGFSLEARAVLLATGVYDALPQIGGVAELWGKRVFVCPYCDGWEMRDKRLAVLGKGKRAAALAQELWQWSDDLVVCTEGVGDAGAAQKTWMERVGATVHESPLVCVEAEDAQTLLLFEDGTRDDCAALFLCAPLRQRYPLVEMLGLQIDESGSIRVDDAGRTGAAGVYAAGDAVTDVHQVILAAASGVCAAMALNEDLLAEEVARASRTR